MCLCVCICMRLFAIHSTQLTVASVFRDTCGMLGVTSLLPRDIVLPVGFT